jgi:hypothetical protein
LDSAVTSLPSSCEGAATRSRLATAFAGFAISAFAAYLGGELSFGMRLGTKHTAFPNDPAADFTPVLPVIELKDKPLRVDTGGIAMLLSRDTAGQISAISAICTHRGAALEEGEFAGGCVTCPGITLSFTRHGCRGTWAGIVPARAVRDARERRHD